jgi:hypothetical protein
MEERSEASFTPADSPSRRKEVLIPPPSPASLGILNYLNLLAFFFNYGANIPQAASFDWFSARDINQYKSLLTPSVMTSVIIDVIILFQGIFAVVQMMPSYRSSDLVQRGVGCWYISASTCQLCLILGYASIFDALFSTFFMGAFLVILLQIIKRQSDVSALDGSAQTVETFWLIKFPFLLQTGWAVFLFIWGINIFLTFTINYLWFQLTSFHICLICFVWVGVKTLILHEGKPNYVIPLVLSWAMVSTSKITAFAHSTLKIQIYI